MFSSSFKVDNSSLTGEAEPQTRVPQATHENPMETKNLAFFSSNAVEGTCVGVVVHVGDGTVLGRIAGLASGLDSKKSTLREELDRFVFIITVVAFLDGLILFIVGLLRGYPILEAILIFIAIIVANVPEGILAQITLGTIYLLMGVLQLLNVSLLLTSHLVQCSILCPQRLLSSRNAWQRKTVS